MMKAILTLLLLVSLKTFGQPRPDKFTKFYDFAGGNIREKLNDNFKADCKWHYPLVKVTCDKNSRIYKYEILNDSDPKIKNYFKHLIGYKFDKGLVRPGQHLIFCIAFENRGTDCVLKNVSTPTDGLKQVFAILDEQLEKSPTTIVIYKIGTIGYNEDPIIDKF